MQQQSNAQIGLQTDLQAKQLAQVERLSRLMDNRFRIPKTNIRFGLDSLLGLIPVVGDTAGALTTAYIIKVARENNVPKRHQARMVWNMVIDWLIGLIPFFGDIFDIGFKAHRKNLHILKNHLNQGL